MTRVPRSWLCLSILALTSCLLLSNCGRKGSGDGKQGGSGRGGVAEAADPKKPEARKFKIPVTVQSLSRGSMNAYLQAVGTIRPLKEVEIKSEMSGRVYFEKRWEDGDYVDTGVLLARIDDTTVQLDMREAERALEMAQQSLIPAKASMERAIKEEEFTKKMFERGAYSEVQYEQARLVRIQSESSYQQALTTIETRKTQIAKLKKELERTDIKASFAGILLPAQPPQAGQASAQETDLTLLEGTLVGSGQTVLRLADIRQIVVELDVPSKDIDFVDLGQTVELDIYSKTGQKYIGNVQDISSTLNPTTRTYTVKVNVDNPVGELRPGMFSRARIITETRPDAISIPRELVMLRNNKHVVFIVEEKVVEDDVASATSAVSATAEVESVTASEEDKPGEPVAVPQVVSATEAAGVIEGATDEEEEEEPLTKVMVAKQCEVRLGIENREEVEITEGLEDGDLLVVLGYETLTDGVEVNVSIRGLGEDTEAEGEAL
ncbi:MAG: efflux RND transporter periplasmic adaptor subunit [bacterium]